MRIAVLGAGRMGLWLAHELSQANKVAVYDTRSVDLGASPGVERLAELADLKNYAPEMLINAVSLQNTVAAFESVKAYMPPGCLAGDITSVKGDLPRYYARNKMRFVSLHPMFGPTWANLEALRQENAIVINESDREGQEFFIKLFARLGVKVFECSFREHDEMMAYSLTTPFVASLVFASCIDRTAVPGTTFARHRKIARGLLGEDDHLIAEVLFNPHSIGQLESITSKLEFLKHVIRDRDIDEAKKLFAKLRANVGET